MTTVRVALCIRFFVALLLVLAIFYGHVYLPSLYRRDILTKYVNIINTLSYPACYSILYTK